MPGAAHYEVEVNSSSDFASGSKACCSDKPIAPKLTSVEVFPSNTYYWRVRAINAHGDAGVWGQFDQMMTKRAENVLPAE